MTGKLSTLLCNWSLSAEQQLVTTIAQVVLSPRALTHAAHVQSGRALWIAIANSFLVEPVLPAIYGVTRHGN